MLHWQSNFRHDTTQRFKNPYKQQNLGVQVKQSVKDAVTSAKLQEGLDSIKKITSLNDFNLDSNTKSFLALLMAIWPVRALITDRHRQIAKWIREEWNVTHFFDCWHVVKGTSKRYSVYLNH